MPVFSMSCAIVVTRLRAFARSAPRSRARLSAVPSKNAQASAVG
jgi:hypothetical protein